MKKQIKKSQVLLKNGLKIAARGLVKDI